MNAVIYARYSSHNQTEQSIEGHLRDAYEYAQCEDIKIVGEYIDRAQSGRSDNRTNFQRMLHDAVKGQLQLIIVWKLDRFARNLYDSAINKAKLKKYGVRVVSVKENITGAPEGIIVEGLLESMAEYYSANLAQNVRRGQRENIAKGKFCGGTVSYGYQVVNSKLVVDDKTAWIIRYLFGQYAAGATMKKIVDELKRRGVRSLRGGKLKYSSFTHALTNTTYIGKYKYNGEVIEGMAEPMIDEVLFDKVQIRVKSRAHAPAANKAIIEYLLQGKVFCGHCGSHMVGESCRGKNSFPKAFPKTTLVLEGVCVNGGRGNAGL